MPVPYFPHSGRRKHYWKLRSEGYRELMTKHCWGLSKAYAEKSIRGQRVMQTIVKKTDDYYLCCFQLKDDFWSVTTADARKREAEARREALRVGTDGKGEKTDTGNRQEAETLFEPLTTVHWPIAPDLDPTQFDQESWEAISTQARVCVDSVRAQIRALYPGLTEAELDGGLMMLASTGGAAQPVGCGAPR